MIGHTVFLKLRSAKSWPIHQVYRLGNASPIYFSNRYSISDERLYCGKLIDEDTFIEWKFETGFIIVDTRKDMAAAGIRSAYGRFGVKVPPIQTAEEHGEKVIKFIINDRTASCPIALYTMSPHFGDDAPQRLIDFDAVVTKTWETQPLEQNNIIYEVDLIENTWVACVVINEESYACLLDMDTGAKVYQLHANWLAGDYQITLTDIYRVYHHSRGEKHIVVGGFEENEPIETNRERTLAVALKSPDNNNIVCNIEGSYVHTKSNTASVMVIQQADPLSYVIVNVFSGDRLSQIESKSPIFPFTALEWRSELACLVGDCLITRSYLHNTYSDWTHLSSYIWKKNRAGELDNWSVIPREFDMVVHHMTCSLEFVWLLRIEMGKKIVDIHHL